MTRWTRVSSRRTRRGRQDAAGSARSGVAVDEYDGVILLRSSPDAPPNPDDVAEFAGALAAGEDARDVFTVVVGAARADRELWRRLGGVLDSLRERGAKTVRLALSGAGGDRPGRPAVAQRIADAWGIEVLAPEGGVVIVPGGSLFATGHTPDRGWRSFTPGGESTPLGPRSPAPSWQPALARLPDHTAGGRVVEQVPAGVLVRSAREPRARVSDLCYAVPVDDRHPTVLVGDPEPGGANDLAELLGALPTTTRSTVRLAPYGPVDLLPAGQETADLLGAEVEVLTGVPLLVGGPTGPVVRPVLVGEDGEPTWAPFVEAVACRPVDAGSGSVEEPRLLRWHPPVPGTLEEGVIHLSDRWQVSVTRAGLLVGPRGPAPSVAGRPVSPEQLAVEVRLPDTPADDSLFTDLSRLLSRLGPGLREFVTLHRVRSPRRAGDDEGFRLLRLAIEHGVPLVDPPAQEPPVQERPAAVRTVTTGTAARSRPPAEEPGESSAPAREGSPGRLVSSDAPDADEAPENGPERTDEPAGRPFMTTGAQPLSSVLDGIPLTPVGEQASSALKPAATRPLARRSVATPANRATAARSTTPAVPATPATPAAPAGPAGPPSRGSTPDPAKRSPQAPPAPAGPPAEAAPAPREPATHEPAANASAPAASSAVRPSAPPSGTAGRSPATAATPGEPAAPGTRARPVAASVRRSTDAERTEFRSLVQPVWDRHSAAVSRAMTAMPALRGAQADAARTDLVAVRVYLSGGLGEPHDGAELPHCYAACLGSGLYRLPSYRGVAVRGGLPADGGADRLLPGRLLREPGPVSALPLSVAAGLSAAAGGYVIWSSTGRRARPLLGTAPGATPDEVVFPPGVRFRVLAVRTEGPAPVVLLSEVLGSETEDRAGLDDADQATLRRMDEALSRHAPAASGSSLTGWPDRCAVALTSAL